MRFRFFRHLPWALAAVACWTLAVPEARARDRADLTLVPEMERPPGILYQREEARRGFEKDAGARRGLAALEERVRALWPGLADVDLVELSRYQVEATRSFRWPAEPGELEGRAVAWDDDARLWHLELRGPRLPARYEVVHRHLYFYATFDPSTEELGGLVLTIRGWVLE